VYTAELYIITDLTLLLSCPGVCVSVCHLPNTMTTLVDVFVNITLSTQPHGFFSSHYG